MMKHVRGSVLAILLSTVMVMGVLGCGGWHDGEGDNGTDAMSVLEPSLQALDSRLQSHYTAVTGVMNSADARNTATREVRTATYGAAQAVGLTDEDWQAIRMETEEYDQDMQRILNDLGQSVTMIGACQMMMGGMMLGSANVGNTCPCQPYMNASTEEVEQHLDEMLDLMALDNPSSLWEEMASHRNLMGSSIQQMGSHMRQVYGSYGDGMMGMM